MGTKSGLMAQSTKVSGRQTKQMDLENLFMLTVTFMRVNGVTIRLMGTDPTLMPTVQPMWANGLMTSSMARELRPGLTALSTMDNTSRAKSTGEVP